MARKPQRTKPVRAAGKTIAGSNGKNLEERIRRVAYGLYEKRGRVEGNDLRNWLEAERIVLSGADDANDRYREES